MPSLIQHQKSTTHCPCPRCDPSDSHEALLVARLSAVDKYSCPECQRRFALRPSLEAHQCKSLHAYCYNCDILSSTRQLHAPHTVHGFSSNYKLVSFPDLASLHREPTFFPLYDSISKNRKERRLDYLYPVRNKTRFISRGKGGQNFFFLF